jgi:anaerobic ribonucleoside-triphosphate reductase
VECYGWAKVLVKGSKDQPFYTDLVGIPIQSIMTLEERLKIEEKMQQQLTGGHLTLLSQDDVDQNSDALWAITKRIVTTKRIGFFKYNRSFTHCSHCRKTFFGRKFKCPVCGFVDSLINFNSVSAKYM